MRKNLVAGNWKMNTTVAEGVQLAKAVRYFLLALLLLLIVNRAYLFYRLFRKKNAKSTSQTEEPAEQSAEQPAEEPQSQNSPAEAENCDKDS